MTSLLCVCVCVCVCVKGREYMCGWACVVVLERPLEGEPVCPKTDRQAGSTPTNVNLPIIIQDRLDD